MGQDSAAAGADQRSHGPAFPAIQKKVEAQERTHRLLSNRYAVRAVRTFLVSFFNEIQNFQIGRAGEGKNDNPGGLGGRAKFACLARETGSLPLQSNRTGSWDKEREGEDKLALLAVGYSYSSRFLLPVDPVFAQLVIEAGAADLQEAGGFDPVAPGFLERLKDASPLRLSRGAARDGSQVTARRKRGKTDKILAGQLGPPGGHDGALDHML